MHDQKFMEMFNLSLSCLYQSQLSDAYAAVQNRIMYMRGEQDGHAAGTWFEVGTEDPESDQKILKGIEDGDPAILDLLPEPRVDGQWAGEPSWSDVVYEELSIDIDNLAGDTDDWYDAYCEGFTHGVEDEIVTTIKKRRDEGQGQ